jgi:EAL domain-containing protein (putative c-di-GMP-specific phosphodiesterase class I)
VQLQILRQARCDLVQGFLLGKPRQDSDVTKNLDVIQQSARRVLEI